MVPVPASALAPVLVDVSAAQDVAAAQGVEDAALDALAVGVLALLLLQELVVFVLVVQDVPPLVLVIVIQDAMAIVLEAVVMYVMVLAQILVLLLRVALAAIVVILLVAVLVIPHV